MSDRIDFYEVRSGSEDDWDHVCLCKDENMATTIAQLLEEHDEENIKYHVEHVEIVANVDLEITEY